jgi:hypothetical protein
MGATHSSERKAKRLLKISAYKKRPGASRELIRYITTWLIKRAKLEAEENCSISDHKALLEELLTSCELYLTSGKVAKGSKLHDEVKDLIAFLECSIIRHRVFGTNYESVDINEFARDFGLLLEAHERSVELHRKNQSLGVLFVGCGMRMSDMWHRCLDARTVASV